MILIDPKYVKKFNLENFTNFQFGKFQNLPILKNLKICNLAKFKNFQFGNNPTNQILKFRKLSKFQKCPIEKIIIHFSVRIILKKLLNDETKKRMIED